MRDKKIKITLMMVTTADGLIAKNDHHLPDWSSKEDKEYFAEVTKRAGVMIFGDKTFFTFPSPLPGRLHVVFTMQKSSKAQDNVRWVTGDPRPVLDALAREGYREAVLGGGASLNSLFLEYKLIDELIITHEPLLFGQGLNLFARGADARLELLELRKLNNNTFVSRYKVAYS